jgi:hypothetical protein
VPGSGCGLLFKGDLTNDSWYYEQKSTRTDVLRFRQEWWYKAEAQAADKRKPNVALGVCFTNRLNDYTGHLRFVFVLNQLVSHLETKTEGLILTNRTKQFPQNKAGHWPEIGYKQLIKLDASVFGAPKFLALITDIDFTKLL